MDKYKLRVNTVGVQAHNPFTLLDLSVDCVIKTLVFNNKTHGRKLVEKLVKEETLPNTLVQTLLQEVQPIYRWETRVEYRYFFESYHTVVTEDPNTGVLTYCNYSYSNQTRRIPVDVLRFDSWSRKYSTIPWIIATSKAVPRFGSTIILKNLLKVAARKHL